MARTEVEFRKVCKINRSDLKNFARVSGDYNEIHLNDEVARSRGLPSVIAHGMLIAGYVAARAQQIFNEKEVGAIRFRFKAMTFPEEVISIGGWEELKADNTFLNLEARNEKGEVKIQSSIELLG